jgi:hypothetical protein
MELEDGQHQPHGTKACLPTARYHSGWIAAFFILPDSQTFPSSVQFLVLTTPTSAYMDEWSVVRNQFFCWVAVP